MNDSLTERIKNFIKIVPRGKIATYGQIASYAGNPRAARLVSWILHSSSKKYHLPWYRIVNNKGKISLPKGKGYHRQKKLLEQEGILFQEDDVIDLSKFKWEKK
ncbi:MAG: DNA methyltransferase [Candidatus Lokiarchaeota archaeon]|nr:DNA methyltransferase [Candidatus Lokiarchaeota archaeon]MBD3341288.1 DNA methyltransferase [Candidatus Lokiarchaeota archaeon]